MGINLPCIIIVINIIVFLNNKSGKICILKCFILSLTILKQKLLSNKINNS